MATRTVKRAGSIGLLTLAACPNCPGPDPYSGHAWEEVSSSENPFRPPLPNDADQSPRNARLSDVEFVPGLGGGFVAVGDTTVFGASSETEIRRYGGIWLSDDGGTWTYAKAIGGGGNSGFEAVGARQDLIVAVGYNLLPGQMTPLAVTSTDGGESWVREEMPGRGLPLDIDVNSEGVVAVGGDQANGVVWVREGNEWSREDLEGATVRRVRAVAPGEWLATGASDQGEPMLWRRSAGTWQNVVLPEDMECGGTALRAMAFEDDGSGYITCGGSQIALARTAQGELSAYLGTHPPQGAWERGAGGPGILALFGQKSSVLSAGWGWNTSTIVPDGDHASVFAGNLYEVAYSPELEGIAVGRRILTPDCMLAEVPCEIEAAVWLYRASEG